MNTIETLLEDYWILQDVEKEKYEEIRRNLTEEEANFLKYKLGYKLIVNQYLVKLEKIPGVPKSFMGIKEFKSTLEYIFLCLILLFLEDKSPKEQFILSGLIEFIEQSIIDIDLGEITIDFNLFKTRQSMVRVLKYVRNMGFIKIYDGSENKFAEDVQNDVLYEITGVSKYFVRNFTSNISDCNSYTDIYEKEQLGLEQEKGIERRQRVYRRIFTENIVYQENEDDQDYNYIKNYKNVISQDVDKILNSSFEVHKNGAYIMLSDESGLKNIFPNNKAISDVVLFVDRALVEKKSELEFNNQDIAKISKLEFEQLLKQVRAEYKSGFSKEFREELTDEEFIFEIVDYMEDFDMIRFNEESKEYKIMPICFRVVGKYPKQFEEE